MPEFRTIARVSLAFTWLYLMAVPSLKAGELDGLWKHVDEPGWIEINLAEGRGTVVRNDNYTDRVGREILKELRIDSKASGVWRGQVYAEKLGEYKDAEITLPEPDRMAIKVKVGFISRTVEWVRVENLPAGAPLN